MLFLLRLCLKSIYLESLLPWTGIPSYQTKYIPGAVTGSFNNRTKMIDNLDLSLSGFNLISTEFNKTEMRIGDISVKINSRILEGRHDYVYNLTLSDLKFYDPTSLKPLPLYEVKTVKTIFGLLIFLWDRCQL